MVAIEFLLITFAGYKSLVTGIALAGTALISLFWGLDEDIPPGNDEPPISGLPGREEGDPDPDPPISP